MERQRNVLFLLIDALRADKCWGKQKTAKTPAINSLCERGTMFTQAISATSTTTPSVASILTGTYPPTHGIRSLTGYRLNNDVKTCAEIFRENGYNTYAEVAGPLVPEIALNRGFDEYRCREKVDDVFSEWGDQLVRRFENEEFESPWFIFIHFWELHMPRIVPRGFDNDDFGRNKYDRALSALDAYLKKILAHIEKDVIVVLHADHGEKILETKIEEFFLKVERKIRRTMRRFGLKKKKNLRTVGHGYHIYDYLIRVPLMFVGNGIFPENKVIGAQVSQVDILPTLVDALKLDIHGKFNPDGRSLMPLIRGEQMQEIPVFCEACGAVLPDRSRWRAGIRTPKYKFVYGPYNEKIQEELYDLEEDPNETRNIIRQQPQIAQKFKKILEMRRYHYAEKDRIKRKIRHLKALSKL